jgi:hypothetical protein
MEIKKGAFESCANLRTVHVIKGQFTALDAFDDVNNVEIIYGPLAEEVDLSDEALKPTKWWKCCCAVS